MLNKFSLGNTYFTQELKLPTRKIVAFTSDRKHFLAAESCRITLD